LGYAESIEIHERLLATIKPAKVAGIALRTHGLSEDEARAEIALAKRETGLPADDIVRFGAQRFYSEIAPLIVKSRPLEAIRHA